MPILNVKALPQKDSSKIELALKKTCIAIADCYGCKTEQVWATWEELKAGRYVEGSNSADIQPENTHPPMATLTCFEGKTPEEVEELLLVASKALSEALEIGDNIFMTFHEVRSREVIAGNGVIRK